MRTFRTLKLGALTALAAVAGFAILAGSSAHTQTPAAPPAYRPGLGDMMNNSLQVHHVKLGLAGAHRDWPLAAYEVKELGEAVEDLEQHPSRRDEQERSYARHRGRQ